MFYTDWSTSSRIGRADLDGQNRKADLVSKKIVHPHGITLDFVRQHLYWGDSFLDFIERIDYDGNHRVTIIHGLNVSSDNEQLYEEYCLAPLCKEITDMANEIFTCSANLCLLSQSDQKSLEICFTRSYLKEVQDWWHLLVGFPLIEGSWHELFRFTVARRW